MKNLIVNADDLGWTQGVNRGIADAHRKGLVTSTSLLANGSAFASALQVVRANPELGTGVHLNLSDGPPSASPAEVRALLNKDGNLEGGPPSHLLRIASHSLPLEQVEREWDAQIQKVRDSGITPTHLDGHKHVQMLPSLFEIALKLAKRHGIPAVRVAHEESKLRSFLSTGMDHRTSVLLIQGVQARGLKLLARDAREMADRAGLATTDYFCGIAQTGVMTRAGIQRLLENLPDGTTELMCHPGYVDDDLLSSNTRLKSSRQTELQILTDAAIRKLVATKGIRLISYKWMGEMA